MTTGADFTSLGVARPVYLRSTQRSVDGLIVMPITSLGAQSDRRSVDPGLMPTFASDLAAWTGVIGAAVGGFFGFLISTFQNRVTRSEGREARKHEREMRLRESRATAYVSILDYTSRLVAWEETIREGAEEARSPDALPEAWKVWTGAEWFSMMASLRRVSTPVRQIFQ